MNLSSIRIRNQNALFLCFLEKDSQDCYIEMKKTVMSSTSSNANDHNIVDVLENDEHRMSVSISDSHTMRVRFAPTPQQIFWDGSKKGTQNWGDWGMRVKYESANERKSEFTTCFCVYIVTSQRWHLFVGVIASSSIQKMGNCKRIEK